MRNSDPSDWRGVLTVLETSARSWAVRAGSVSVPAALLLAAGVGCGSSDANPMATGGSSSSTAGSGGSSASAGAPSGGNDSGGSANADPVTYSPCDAEELVGAFRIQLAADYTGVSGSVRNGVVPTDVPELAGEEGACRLLTQRSLFCDPPCGAGQTCGEGESCIEYPANQDVGTVTISGLAVDMTIEPSGSQFYTNPAQPPLPHPGFEPGANIELQAAGGALEPFTLRALGVAALELDEAVPTVAAGQALTIAWTAMDEPEAQRVRFKVEFNRHGGTPTWIECDAPDTGSFEIPATLIDQMLALELSGWPTLTATRRSVGSAELAVGCAELQVFSQTVRDIVVEGVVSCGEGNPCPDAQACQANLTCP